MAENRPVPKGAARVTLAGVVIGTVSINEEKCKVIRTTEIFSVGDRVSTVLLRAGSKVVKAAKIKQDDYVLVSASFTSIENEDGFKIPLLEASRVISIPGDEEGEGINTAVIHGNIVKAPTSRTINNKGTETTYVNFTVAVTESRWNPDTEKREEMTAFVPVDIKLDANRTTYAKFLLGLSPGTSVLIDGVLKGSEKNDRFFMAVASNNVVVTSWKQQESESGPRKGAPLRRDPRGPARESATHMRSNRRSQREDEEETLIDEEPVSDESPAQKKKASRGRPKKEVEEEPPADDYPDYEGFDL